MDDTTLLILIAGLCLAVILVALLVGFCVYRFTSKGSQEDLYTDHIALTFKRSFFTTSPPIKHGSHFLLRVGTKPKQRLELSHVDSDTVLVLEMSGDISPLTRDHFVGSVETLKKLAKHDHVITLYGTYDAGQCTVVEYAQFGTLKYYLSYGSYKSFFENGATFDTQILPPDINPGGGVVETLQMKRALFAYPRMAMECRRTPLPEQTLYYLLWQICLGMEFLHQHDFVHGSLCSYNVLVTSHLTVKVNCFSLAFEDKDALRAIPRWMAPEVFYNKTLSKPADVWSFCVTAWELFHCGTMPYTHLTVDEVIEKTRDTSYRLRPPPGERSLSRLFDECFRIRPTERPSFSQIRLVLERLLEDSEVALTNKFIESRRLQYTNTTLLSKVFDDNRAAGQPEQSVQRALYFTLPSLPGASITRTGSISRIPIDVEIRREMERAPAIRRDIRDTGRSFDVSYADPEDMEFGHTATGGFQKTLDEQMEAVSVASSTPEFRDVSADSEREYNNVTPTISPVTPSYNSFRAPGRVRRVSSLNDLVKFREGLLATRDEVLDRPRSVHHITEDCAEPERKKHRSSHASLRRLGSALHASFRRIRGKEDSGYETLPKRHDPWDRRSFRNLLRTPIKARKWKPSHGETPDTRSSHRRVSQSENCLLLGHTDKRQIEHLQRNFRGVTNMSDSNKAISNSSCLSVPISLYSDYEIPDEVIEASLRQDATLLSQGSLTVPSIPKSHSEHRLWDRSSTLPPRRRANSEFTVVERSVSLARIRSGKSVSEILGAPPAIPTTRRPSILCTCCDSVHANLPGMSLTLSHRQHRPACCTSSEEDPSYDSVPAEEESDYETLDQITSLTHVTTTDTTATLTLETGLSGLSLSPDMTTSSSSTDDCSIMLE